jgi:hypothetical protein
VTPLGIEPATFWACSAMPQRTAPLPPGTFRIILTLICFNIPTQDLTGLALLCIRCYVLFEVRNEMLSSIQMSSELHSVTLSTGDSVGEGGGGGGHHMGYVDFIHGDIFLQRLALLVHTSLLALHTHGRRQCLPCPADRPTRTSRRSVQTFAFDIPRDQIF